MKKRSIKNLMAVFALALSMVAIPVTSSAADKMTDSGYITISLDGEHYLVGQDEVAETHSSYEREVQGVRPSNWYSKGTTIETGIESVREDLQKGQHYYGFKRTGEIPVGKWIVTHEEGSCIHVLIGEHSEYGGYSGLDKSICHYSYPSGWAAYCADCGKRVQPSHVYATYEAIKTIRSINVDYGYMYMCPSPVHKTRGYNFGHLENQCEATPHICDAVSWNMYEIEYKPNYPDNATHKGGSMNFSYHMYNNETMRNGEPVSPVTHLTKASYYCDGYRLVGWNIEVDGVTTYVPDGGEIFNLCEYDYEADGDKGTIVAYGVWELDSSTLRIDPNGGTYLGTSAITEITQGYNTIYDVKNKDVVASKGPVVSFNANGGEARDYNDNSQKVLTKVSENIFVGWNAIVPPGGEFYGIFKKMDDTYYRYKFKAPNGESDTIKAEYEQKAIVLPTAVRSGYQFAGWYTDSNCIKGYVGVGGDKYLPKESQTLFAKWSALTLRSEDNYVDNDKKGAADLYWSEDEAKGRIYKLFISDDGAKTFKPIATIDEGDSAKSYMKNITTTGKTTYTVEATGVYDISALGSGGEAYGDYKGGKGASVDAKVYLEKGDVLTIIVGDKSADGGEYSGGKGSKFGNGGGATVVTSAKQGLILVAGGGGGATATESGKSGGAATSVLLDNESKGANGGAGGGGGYQGGAAGEYEVHNHVDKSGNKTNDVDGTKKLSTKGGCYGREVVETVHCSIKEKKEVIGYFDGSIYYDENGNIYHGLCRICNSYTCRKDHPSYGAVTYYCETHSSNLGSSSVCSQSSKRYYTLDCGYEEGEIEKASASYGGSSYVGDFVITSEKKSGVNSKVGSCKIQSSILGICDVTELKGVPAPDLVAPNIINESTVSVKETLDSVALVTFTIPEDNGTQYWFKAESHPQTGMGAVNESNITTNTLVTGVDKYRYVLDSKDNTEVKKTDDYIARKGTSIETVNIEMGGKTNLWLHIAPEDVAGNLGGTIHINLQVIGDSTVHTSQVSVSGVVNGRDYKNVYSNGSNTYVRANGDSPVKFSYKASIGGRASLSFFVNQTNYEVTVGSKTQNFVTKLPNATESDLTSSSVNIPVSSINDRRQEGDSIFIDKCNFGASRRNSAVSVDYYQVFAIPSSFDGQTISVMPYATAGTGSSLEKSDRNDDLRHIAKVIADGKAPDISGADIISTLAAGQDISTLGVVNITAADGGSGVRDLYVEVFNEDTDDFVKFGYDSLSKDGKSATLTLNTNFNSYLYTGDFCIKLVAVDNVGNVNEKIYSRRDFSLNAKLEKLLPSDELIFMEGECGIIKLRTYGYVDKVEVIFPEEMTNLNKNLNVTYNYTFCRELEKLESYKFIVPIGTPENDNYKIKVKAYKKGEVIEDSLLFCDIVVRGSVLNSVKTRLR